MSGDATEFSYPWFAVYVKNRHEKNVRQILEGKGYEAFLPTYVKLHDNSKKFELPLFPGYVFCRLNAARPLPVLTTPGVFSIVSNGCSPVAIPEEEIEGVRRVSLAGLSPRPWPYVSAGQIVNIESGPLRGVEGVVISDKHDSWLVISVNLLQRSVAVKVERSSVRGAEPWAAAASASSAPYLHNSE